MLGRLPKLWRSLTSMKTALILLFLLAAAAIPGALLPQRPLNEQKTAQYIADRGSLGMWMDRLQLFDVFASSWFTAIYVLLFVSLVGCLAPRILEHLRAVRARPVPAPRNLTRLPRHIEDTVEGDPDEVAALINANLRGWRRVTTTRPATGTTTAVEISAEKGYLREWGNLVFHFALLALLIAIAADKLYGYEGTRSLVADGTQGLCNTSTAVYDSFRAGSLVDGTDLSPFCVRVEGFDARFLPSGQPDMYEADVTYTGDVRQRDPATWNTARIRVNEPLRVAGDRVYVLGNGFAPTFTVTFSNGEQRTQTVLFIPDDLQTMLSSGAARFDTPAGLYPNADERRNQQIAIEGLFAPTAAFQGTLLTSSSPVPNDPYVAIRIYQGDTGLDTGRPQNAYSLNQALIEQGRLQQRAQVNLRPGETHTIADGTVVRFDGYERFVSMQVSRGPAQNWVLLSATVMLAGLLVSLLIRRRRIWVRLVPVKVDGQRVTAVTIAGLARTDQAGWGEDFTEQARRWMTEPVPTDRRPRRIRRR
ncbi:ResB family protein [Gordonia bronchialis DSM 43247]|uniref:ResB family protein n=2 Tax=Gordonia bronchialis TaxID=2054 RepID=D0LEY8_GORB4|nr:ResB family protein [Gordonia bronchialis DSM 43247]QGS26991.1 cytochrome C biogenesis protein ResB [Gordonia bronchialis]